MSGSTKAKKTRSGGGEVSFAGGSSTDFSLAGGGGPGGSAKRPAASAAAKKQKQEEDVAVTGDEAARVLERKRKISRLSSQRNREKQRNSIEGLQKQQSTLVLKNQNLKTSNQDLKSRIATLKRCMGVPGAPAAAAVAAAAGLSAPSSAAGAAQTEQPSRSLPGVLAQPPGSGLSASTAAALGRGSSMPGPPLDARAAALLRFNAAAAHGSPPVGLMGMPYHQSLGGPLGPTSAAEAAFLARQRQERMMFLSSGLPPASQLAALSHLQPGAAAAHLQDPSRFPFMGAGIGSFGGAGMGLNPYMSHLSGRAGLAGQRQFLAASLMSQNSLMGAPASMASPSLGSFLPGAGSSAGAGSLLGGAAASPSSFLQQRQHHPQPGGSSVEIGANPGGRSSADAPEEGEEKSSS